MYPAEEPLPSVHPARVDLVDTVPIDVSDIVRRLCVDLESYA
jgi:hypothetical protein